MRAMSTGMRVGWATLALLGALNAPVLAQKCSQSRIDQESYVALSDLVYGYVPKIDKSSGGWKSFTVRVLAGQYRRPLLLSRGLMKESDLNKLLSSRRDISQVALPVPAHNPKSGTKPASLAPVSFKTGRSTATARVVNVELASGTSIRSDRITLEVCGL